jgi:hypothetical protein
LVVVAAAAAAAAAAAVTVYTCSFCVESASTYKMFPYIPIRLGQ